MARRSSAELYKPCMKCFHTKENHLYYERQDNNKHPCMKLDVIVVSTIMTLNNIR